MSESTPHRNDDAISFFRDHFDLDEKPARQGARLDSRPGRGLIFEIAPVDVVHGGEIVDIGKVDRGLGNVGQGEAEIAEDGSQVLHDLFGLGGHVVGSPLARRRIDAHLSRHEHKIPRLNRYRIGTERIGGARRFQHSLGHDISSMGGVGVEFINAGLHYLSIEGKAKKYTLFAIKKKNGKFKNKSLQSMDLNPYSIKDAQDAHSKLKVQKRENKLFEASPDTEMTFKQLADWYLSKKSVKKLASYDTIITKLRLFNDEFGDKIVADIKLDE